LLTTNNGLKIELKNVSYSYPNTKFKVLQDINFTIYPGEKIALIGENGSGKSTLVKLISGLLEPSDGEIRINGQIITSKSPLHKISVVFQDRSEEHTSELQSRFDLVCRLLLEKKKKSKVNAATG